MFSGVNPFGGGGGGSNKKDDISGSSSNSNSSSTSNNSGGGGNSLTGFDSSGLERAAKAAKDLEKSRNAKEIIRLQGAQETTKQKEQEAKRAEFQAHTQQLAIQKVKEEEAAAQRTLEKQTQHNRNQADYQDQLERKRIVEQMQMQKRTAEEERAKAEESLRRQEEIRKRTIEYEAELRQQTEMARVKAETEGRIKQERKNFDLTVETKKLEAAELRDTVLESIKLASKTLGAGAYDFMTDREKLTNFAATATMVALGYFTAKTGTGVAGRFIEARLGKPSLVRETSKKNVLQMIKSPLSTARMAFTKGGGVEGESAALKDIVLEDTLSKRLQRVAVSTANTKVNRAPYRHLLLHGPPGTGKTMFAKGLAKESGLHYAIMTGGDVAPLGKDAVTEIHKIFDWANTTTRGVMLFVDEADAFLRKRSTADISEDQRNALNAFLYRTGEASSKVMLVYASNQPEQFDWAINDRIDDMVQFTLPSLAERSKMIAQYMDKYLLKPTESKPITISGIDEQLLSTVAKRTEGFSGREISKLAIAWQAAAYGTEDASLNGEMLLTVLEEQLSSKRQKQSWLSAEEVENMTKDYDN
jgi:ATPase family AAA domain-containing protein 3A/B